MMIVQDLFTDFFRHFHFMPTHSLVLNLKKSVKKRYASERVDNIVAEKTYHSFLKCLSKKCVPHNHYRRYKTKLTAIASCEISSSYRPHLHILIKKPDHLCESTFLKLIRETADNNEYVAPSKYAVHITNLTLLPDQHRHNIMNYNMKDINKPDAAFIM